MDRESFWHIHDLIVDDLIFFSKGKPQRSPKYQLATFLCRVGSETAVKTAAIIAIAEGTVYKYSERVCKALHNIRADHLAFPGGLRREFLSEEMDTKWCFPGCLGSGDGSYFHLINRPVINGFAYWCRKKFYAVSLFFFG